MKDFGERLKTLRKEANITQAELAEKLNVHLQTISKWERCKSEPDISQMGDLAKILNVTLEKLFGVDDIGETYDGAFSAVNLGLLISSLRTSNNESQEQLAQSLSVSSDAVSRWERGITCPDIGKLTELSVHFGQPLSKIYYGISDAQIQNNYVIKKGNRRNIFLWLSSVVAVLSICALFLVIFLPKNNAVTQPVLTYTVIFDGEEYLVNENDWFSPQAKQISGYDFKGLKNASEEEVSVPCKITSDCEFTSVYVPHEYKVTYWLNGGGFESSVKDTITVEDEPLILPKPKKEGATFDGWFVASDFKDNAITEVSCTLKDVYLYAKWKNITYTVIVDGKEYTVNENDWFSPQTQLKTGYDFIEWQNSDGDKVTFPYKVTDNCEFISVYTPRVYSIDYWLNGGNFAASEVENTFTVESGTVNLPVPEKIGAKFEGWHLKDDYSDDALTSVSCNAHDIKLYAEWSDRTYSVRYELNGGILYESNPQSVSTDAEVFLNNPIRRGYLFLGWFDLSGETEKQYYAVGGIGAKNLVLNAVWQKCDAIFKIEYELNGGEISAANPQTVNAGERHTLNEPSKTGYDFVGWNDKADGSGEFYKYLLGISDDLKLYAIFNAKQYLIRYEYDGIYENETNPNYVTYGEKITLLPVYKFGYDFSGWFDGDDENGKPVSVIDESNILSINVLYAKFSPIIYKIVLNADGGTMTTPDGEKSEYTYELKFGENLTLPECEKGGYNFLGWVNADGETVTQIDSLNIANMSLTASWRESDKRYNIYYELNGGTQEQENPVTVLCGQSLPLNDPARENYLFLGWYDDADGKGNVYKFTPADRETDLTLYAIWQEIKISGSSKDFVYEKNTASGTVTITGYKGAYGENVDLVIPSLIEGLPVVAIEGMRADDLNRRTLRSVAIPDGIVKLSDYSFKNLIVLSPLIIPKSVAIIDGHCFTRSILHKLYFETENLKSIGESAFERCEIHNILHLPEGLEELEYNSFYSAKLDGIILPDSLKRINAGALLLDIDNYQLTGIEGLWTDFRIYLPEGVEYIATNSVKGAVFVGRAEEETENYMPQWRVNPAGSLYGTPYGIKPYVLKLHDEDKTTELYGVAFELPVPEKEGYTFVGWQNKAGYFASNYFIWYIDYELYAVYEKITENDGRDFDRIATFKLDTVYELDIRGGTDFYFKLEDLSLTSISVGFEGTRSNMLNGLNYCENGSIKDVEKNKKLIVSSQGYFSINVAFYCVVTHIKIWVSAA